jgi:D-inositol-3-phosphate glycosyltransferase
VPNSLPVREDLPSVLGARRATPDHPFEIEVALLTGGFDKPYALGLAMALVSNEVRLDYVGSGDVDSPQLHTTSKVCFFNLLGDPRERANLPRKVTRILTSYSKLIRYASVARPLVFHILWNNRLQWFDRTLLTLYYKLLGKKIAYTAHNVNAGRRDGNDSVVNRLTLRIQYRLVDHIFVHTETMKTELLEDFGVAKKKVTVIPFGINDSVPSTELTPAQAKQRLGIANRQRTILFFGNIGPYKGIEILVEAFHQISAKNANYHLIIAGKPRGGCEQYVAEIQEAINSYDMRERVATRIEFIPDEETELYFKAADLLVLPYKEVYQSGVLFLGYNFGLPVVATNVGSLREDIITGETGFVCRPCDPVDLAETIERYFKSDLFKALDSRRRQIKDFAKERYSWNHIGRVTRDIYAQLQGKESL